MALLLRSFSFDFIEGEKDSISMNDGNDAPGRRESVAMLLQMQDGWSLVGSLLESQRFVFGIDLGCISLLILSCIISMPSVCATHCSSSRKHAMEYIEQASRSGNANYSMLRTWMINGETYIIYNS